MTTYIEHHTKYYGWGCSVFDNDEEFNLVDIGQWYYLCGQAKPNYPMPAIPYHSFVSPLASITIWPGFVQYRISDIPYTGFGKVITIEHGIRCEARYDDFN